MGGRVRSFNGALSLGLLSTGVVAFPVGTWIDRHGGRGVMTLCSLAGGLLLLAWAQVETPWVFYCIWVCIGASMAGVLYEPAFAVITAVFGPEARRGITALTLVGGFASTVFMPLTQLLIGALGWRTRAPGPRGAQPRGVPAAPRPVCPWNDQVAICQRCRRTMRLLPPSCALFCADGCLWGWPSGLRPTTPRSPPLSSSSCRC